MLKEFKVSTNWWSLSIWGNGHTALTDPISNGWVSRKAGKNPDCVLVGRRGVEGCFSAVPLSDGKLDVAFYYETPEFVAKEWLAGRGVDAHYVVLQDSPGWGLNAIDKLDESYPSGVETKCKHCSRVFLGGMKSVMLCDDCSRGRCPRDCEESCCVEYDHE